MLMEGAAQTVVSAYVQAGRAAVDGEELDAGVLAGAHDPQHDRPGDGGITDMAAAMRDGRSSTGTLGIGLGAIARHADTFDLHSIPGQGTVMLARFWPRSPPTHAPPNGGLPPAVTAGLTRPINGARECGDGWAARWHDLVPPAPAGPPASSTDADTRTAGPPPAESSSGAEAVVGSGSRRPLLVMLCDGLGHGPLAQIATRAAVRAFHASPGHTPEAVMGHIHQALASTRGGAVAVARIDPDQEQVLYCAVGNIAGAVITPNSKSVLSSRYGNVGHQLPTLRTSAYVLPPGGALVLHSDGLTERWDPQELPGLLQHTPPVIPGSATTAGTYTDLSTCNGSAGQQWTYARSGNLTNPHSGYCLDGYGGSSANGTRLDIWPCGTNQNNQVWSLPQSPGWDPPGPTPQ
ncbi:RICIN domain-containing protein [Streptacidiphilus sp. P02-A3a]|uniref:RICIN domain-containing protein n=1 Tax=Streptacidiphilus sp. P02-A3a TaxID=2704468 RepID=UPI0015F7F676|nr:RICIN domain-containing protein [Streptacidiphilus sp. P02-A3a]QMU69105.1 SpoIIE family protein phosphatase [Streptacidiphilus sp. P02-A3a]